MGRVIEFVAKVSKVHSLVMHAFIHDCTFILFQNVSNVQIRNDHRF